MSFLLLLFLVVGVVLLLLLLLPLLHPPEPVHVGVEEGVVDEMILKKMMNPAVRQKQEIKMRI